MLKNKKGFSLVDLIVSMAITSIVITMSHSYLSFYIKNINTAKGYVNQEETGHFVERFFKIEDQCTATLKRAEQIPGVEFTIEEVVPIKRTGISDTPGNPQVITNFFPNLKTGIRFTPLPLKNNKDLALMTYTVSETDEKTGSLKEREKSFYIDILRNNEGAIEKCLGSSIHVNQCKGGYEHILTYDESSLNPITTSLIEKTQVHGKVFKTLTKTKNLSCLSFSSCEQGEWQSDISCYNSCTDKFWSKGDNKYRNLDITDCAGGTSVSGQIKECSNQKEPWCPEMSLNLSSCCVERSRMDQFCNNDKAKPPTNTYSSEDIRQICESTAIKNNMCTSSTAFKFPASNYGKAIPIIRSAKKYDLTFGYQSVYAKCEYTGEWHIMGITCDEHPRISESKPKSIYGREKNAQNICVPKYPSSKCTCSTSQRVTLHPSISRDSEGNPIDSKTLTIKEIFDDKIDNQVACGVPIQFTYDFKGKDSLAFTYSCDTATRRFKQVTRSKYCEAKERKPKLDMVFVIDNSGSMAEEQNNLATNLDSFFNQFLSDKINFNIAVITTDYQIRKIVCNHPDCVGERFDDSISSVKTALQTAVRAGTSGSGSEVSFAPVMHLAYNHRNFFRRRAVLSIFFLTDEDNFESFTDYNVKGSDFLNFLTTDSELDATSKELFTFWSNYRGLSIDTFRGLNHDKEKMIVFAGINDEFSASRFPGSSCNNPFGNPVNIRRFMSQFDGVTISDSYRSPREVDLCNPNFANRLTSFGTELASLLKTSDPPQRPAILNILDQNNIDEDLKIEEANGFLQNNIECSP